MKNLPTRIERRRTKHFKLPPNTVCITRGTAFGNPIKVGEWWVMHVDGLGKLRFRHSQNEFTGATYIEDNQMAVEWYRQWIEHHPLDYDQRKRLETADHLACFCKPVEPCHGDVLLDILRKQTEF